jgi:hypothetical protein
MMQTRIQNTVVAVVLVLVVVSAAVAAPVAAQTSEDSDDDDAEQSVADTLLGVGSSALEDPGGALDAVRAMTAGVYANVKYHSPFREPVRDVDECAADIREEFNAHNATYLSYANERISASTARDVVEIECTAEADGDTESRSVYLVATVNESSNRYDSATVVTETDRTVDHRVRLSGLATEEMPDDFARYTSDYAEPDKTPTRSFKSEMVSKYMGHVSGTFEWLPEEDG